MMYDANQNKIQGWMSNIGLDWLYEQARKYKNIAEIGSWRGRSTHALASGTKGYVFAIDHWKGSASELHSAHKEATDPEKDIFIEFTENMKPFHNVVSIRIDHFLAPFIFADGCFDMIFIDGDHKYENVKYDVNAWLPKLAPNGLFCGHDYEQAFLPKIAGELGLNIKKIDIDSLWILEA